MHDFPFFLDGARGWRRIETFEPPEPVRWARPREVFELDDELVCGETVLRDLTEGPQTTGSATRILARFTTLRFLIISQEPGCSAEELLRERGLAQPYVAVLRAPPAEARALRALVALGRPAPPRRIMTFLHDAATTARTSKHSWGGFALHRFAYGLAVERGWHEEGARAADAIALIARQCGATHAPRLWGRRARILHRRAGAH